MKFDFKKFLSYYKPYLRLFLSVLFCAIVAAVYNAPHCQDNFSAFLS
jgi:hypothetical protein